MEVIMVKKELKQKETNLTKTLVELIKNNYTWSIAVITALGIVILNVFKFVEYIIANAYFYYYGLNINLYKYHDQNFLYELCLSVIFVFSFGIILIYYKQLSDNFKNKNYLCKSNLDNILKIIILNIFFVFIENSNNNFISGLVSFVIFVLVEVLISYFLFRKNKQADINNMSKQKILFDFIRSLPLIFIVIICCLTIKTTLNLSLKNQYRIIDENKAIVYTSNDYYLTLNCEILEDKLVLHKGAQTKINNIGVYSELKEFEEVEIK